MLSSVLLLYDTDIASIDGQAPASIELGKSRTVVGRGSPQKPVDVVLSAKKERKEIISRQHAEIIRNSNGEYEIKDLNALNGVFVNGVRVLSKVLQHLDIIQFGGLCDVPVGKTLVASDLCVKYKFMRNHIISSSKKRSADDVESTLGKLSKVDSSARSHSPLNGRMQSVYPKLELNAKSPTSSPEKKPQPPRSDDSLLSSSAVKRSVSSDCVLSSAEASKVFPFKMIDDATATGVPLSTMRDSLNCTLCNDILLDAVVMRCSHGYCRCCIEQHLRRLKSTCPVCNDKAAPSALGANPRTTGYLNVVYHRSLHLDLLVGHLLDVSSAEVREGFKMREVKDRQTLAGLGIDPDRTCVEGEELQYEAAESATRDNDDDDDDCASAAASEDDDNVSHDGRVDYESEVDSSSDDDDD